MKTSVHPSCRFAGQTWFRRGKVQEPLPIQSMDTSKLLKTLEAHLQHTPSLSEPESRRILWSVRLSQLQERLVEVIRELPSQKAAQRLFNRMAKLKHLSGAKLPRVQSAMMRRLPVGYLSPRQRQIQERDLARHEARADQLLDALGYDQEFEPKVRQFELDTFFWGFPVEASTPDY